MNILFISLLNGGAFNGPTYSIPKQIASQKEFDNVFWYNLAKGKKEWTNIDYYHDINDYPSQKISDLPEPYNNPDLVVFEQFYGYTPLNIKNEVLKFHIPYVIIPRGELTQSAQSSKRLKKSIANLLLMNRFANNAAAIQYLTQNEYKESTAFNTNKFIVVPNGVDMISNVDRSFKSDSIHCVFIGRLDPFHKGLDLLIEACDKIKDILCKNKVIFEIYGANTRNKLDELEDMIVEKHLENIVSLKGAVYDKDKDKVLRSSDVFVMTSRFEGHPMALVEALAYGMPCLVTDGTNMRAEIDEAVAGWGADTNVDSIVQAMKAMINSHDHFSEISKNAINLAKDYSWSKLARITHEEYLKLLSKEEQS